MTVVSDYTALIRLFTLSGGGGTAPSYASWNLHSDVGNPVFVTYSFSTPENLPEPGEITGATATSVLTAAEKAAVRAAMAQIEAAAGVTFVEVAGRAMVNLADATLPGLAGRSGVPITAEYQTSEVNTVFDRTSEDPTTDAGMEVVLHELLHALGLEHPHEGVNTLATALDSDATTLLSYVETGVDYTELRPMDIAALRFLYGPSQDLSAWSYGMVADRFELRGAATADWITGVKGANKLLGLQGDDRLTGRLGDDTLSGGLGDDTLVAGRGADKAKGGAGDDLIRGDGRGNPLDGAIAGRGGADTIAGGAGADSLYGGAGDDKIQGGLGADRLFGEEGADTLLGGKGADLLDGGVWQDSLLGGGGRDTLNGGDNFDTLEGGVGRDILSGGAGSDLLIGGAGPDRLEGGESRDTLTGGAGRDVFVFQHDARGSWDTLTDFDPSRDRIDLPGSVPAASISVFGAYTFNGLLGTLVQTDGTAGFTLHFAGLSASDVTEGWNDFVI